MEKCGKLWRSDHGNAAGQEVLNEIYAIAGASGAMEMRACSACAGNYEDPDRTVWTPDDVEDDERDGTPRVPTEEFPAEE